MSIKYQLIQEGITTTAVLKNIEIPENIDSIGYGPSFMQRGTETKLKFDTCIMASISDIFYKYSPNVTKIEVTNSIVDRIDMKVLKKFTKLEEFSFINSTLNDFNGTIFEDLKDFSLKIEKQDESDESKVAALTGKICFKNLDKKEDDGDQATGSSTGLNANLNGRPILSARSSKTFNLTAVPAPSPPVSLYGAALAPSQSTFGSGFGSQPGIFGTSTFGQQPSSNYVPSNVFGIALPVPVDQSPKRSCDSSQTDQKSVNKIADHRSNLKEKYTKSQTINANLSKDLEVLRDQIMKLEAENKKLKESGILADLKKIFHDEAFKDFTVNVNKEKFKVHKILFAARSSVIADLIRNNPEDFELDLKDIPLPIFEILLHFIYNDTALDGDENLIATYAAAGRLNIKDLKNLTAQKLMDKVDDKNAFKLLELSNKYGNDELRLKAFEEIKKVLSDYKLNDEFSKKPEKIKKLLDMKKKMDEEYEKMQQELDENQETNNDQQEVEVAEGGSDSYEIVD